MTLSVHFNLDWLNKLIQSPNQIMTGMLGNTKYTAKILIPSYRRKIEMFYGNWITSTLDNTAFEAKTKFRFDHFGVEIYFDEATEVNLYNEELVLHPGLCDLMKNIGPVILKNAYFDSDIRSYGHRNRFPHLQFHIDRSEKQVTRYSLYTRDPFDEEQKHPRTASTLFVANVAAYLQSQKQNASQASGVSAPITSCLLYENEDMRNILGNVVLEQPWDEPEGTGEIAMIDNATVLHASYYRDANRSGYKIGVRYLAGI